MKLHLYNTLGRTKDEFKPLVGKKVGLYTCGPTVYNYAHLGNLRAYIFSDILKRTLVYNGYKVKHVMNVTDVGHLTSDADTGEDKLEKGAIREDKTVWDVAKFYEEAFRNDIKKLNIIEPDKWSRATEHIKEQVKLVKDLQKNGYAYDTEEAVYFDVEAFEKDYPGEYIKLSSQNLDDKKVGVRDNVKVDDNKKHPVDFALWFKRVGKYADHVMYWSSPWGDGFPGWHVECSAMSIKYLGKHFDIHTGGIDHIAVHHTNERVQNMGSIGHEVVQRWMHNEFLVIKDGEKMAKSGDNLLTLQSLIDKGFHPLAFRYLCLQTHYRKAMEYSDEAIRGAYNSWIALYNRCQTLLSEFDNKKVEKIDKKFQEKFINAIYDDLNTPQALALINELLKSDISNENKLATIVDFDKVLGLDLFKVRKINIPLQVVELAKKRLQLKKDKKYDEADKLRGEIEDKGFVVEDTSDGYNIKKK